MKNYEKFLAEIEVEAEDICDADFLYSDDIEHLAKLGAAHQMITTLATKKKFLAKVIDTARQVQLNVSRFPNGNIYVEMYEPGTDDGMSLVLAPEEWEAVHPVDMKGYDHP